MRWEENYKRNEGLVFEGNKGYRIVGSKKKNLLEADGHEKRKKKKKKITKNF